MDERNRNGYGVYSRDDDEEGLPLERESADGAFGAYVSGEDDDDGLDENSIDFDDPKIANLPRIILMGPRRAGKTSIQVCLIVSIIHYFFILGASSCHWNHNVCINLF